MAKVSTIHSTAIEADPFEDAVNPRGEVRAWTFIDVKDIFGNQRVRKISLGYTSCTLDTAKRMIANARQDQVTAVNAKFEIFL